MEKDNYENHITMLLDFKQNLVALQRHIQVIKEKYQKQIDVMENAGFVEDIILSLKHRFQAFSSQIDEIDRQLMEHNHKIDVQKETLTTLRSIARMN
ncbi:MAG: Unknown protein [uncultured Sulfurovum sp.]|uniref:Uncharacterized protein n=1 Tax=uncultured Sulfurovum sp. TaxID=269237 RepID=A0A6S6TBW7_9BACT|nr:MAG: Unknown protein [uncultured Sulfurovum sp.]